MMDQYDVIVIGSGIGGGTLAISLSKIGCRTLVIEKNQHPRFSIGESTVPSTTLAFNRISDKYEIPEFKKMFHYLGLRELGITAFPKGQFWFGFHEENKEIELRKELTFETFPLPYGPDIHVKRAELDTYTVGLFEKYNVSYIDKTTVLNFTYDDTREISVLQTDNSKYKTVEAKLIIDCSGHNGFIATQEELIDNSDIRTSTRAIFGHFTNIEALDSIYGQYEGYRLKREGGTMHHCFEGGWIWVIPFDDETVSVGIILENELYPLDESISAEDEMQHIISKYPSIKAHLGEMKANRPVIRTGRIQFSAKQIVGDGYILSPHASGFIDPLYSSGMLLTGGFIERLLPRISKALFYKDFSKAQFLDLEEDFKREIETVDKVVHGSIQSFRNYDIYKQFMRVWAAGNMIQLFIAGCANEDIASSSNLIYGCKSDEWKSIIDRAYDVVMNKELPNEEIIRQLAQINEEYSNPFDVSNFAIDSDQPCLITIVKPSKDFYDFAIRQLKHIGVDATKNPNPTFELLTRAAFETGIQRTNYALSKISKSTLSQGIDELYSLIGSPNYKGARDFYAPFNDPWHGRYLKKKRR